MSQPIIILRSFFCISLLVCCITRLQAQYRTSKPADEQDLPSHTAQLQALLAQGNAYRQSDAASQQAYPVRSSHVAGLQIKYPTDQDIQLLINSAQLKQTQIEKAALVQKITYLGGIIVLIIAGLCYYGYHIKTRSNRQLLIQQKEIKAKNESLQLLLGEKEWLLREIHHRVKNNLQIVISLLNMQSGHLTNEALTAIRRSQDRISAMSLIHQRLYQSDALAMVNMKEYINDLISQLKDNMECLANISYELSSAPVQLEVSQAVPVALILNEAVTNAMIHSFSGRKQGRISVSLQPGEVANQLVLLIGDDGIGLPPALEQAHDSSIGINLIKMLTRQLNGSLSMINDPGLVIKIEFNIEMDSDFTTRGPVAQQLPS
ncbi:sensor histidine kinase [uncultured Chitinophaga sp.]|uniref:sensor histidine kinase n=1 Tax=uncultured Chitinophaga sp. TaxID=339340 RepID=UPI0025FB261C|nr:sensor histidine kinase [uncultured Chitinophaga sp.]